MVVIGNYDKVLITGVIVVDTTTGGGGYVLKSSGVFSKKFVVGQTIPPTD